MLIILSQLSLRHSSVFSMQILLCQIFSVPIKLYSSSVTTYKCMFHPQCVSSILILFSNPLKCLHILKFILFMSVLHVPNCGFSSVCLHYWLYFNHIGKLSLAVYFHILILVYISLTFF